VNTFLILVELVFALYLTSPLQSVKCTNDSLADIVRKHKCHLVSDTISTPSSYMLPNNVTRDSNFEVSKVDCIGGYIHDKDGRVPAGRVLQKFDNITLSNDYYTMLPMIRKVLNISHEFVTMHWRRGDQLQSRCPGSRDKERFKIRDTSINCHSVDDFINITRNLLKKEDISSASVVVATNERSHEVVSFI